MSIMLGASLKQFGFLGPWSLLTRAERFRFSHAYDYEPRTMHPGSRFVGSGWFVILLNDCPSTDVLPQDPMPLHQTSENRTNSLFQKVSQSFTAVPLKWGNAGRQSQAKLLSENLFAHETLLAQASSKRINM